MDYVVFGSSPSGRLVPTIQNQRAFVPYPLPGIVDHASLFQAFGKATGAMASLNAKIQQLSNPSLILRPLQRREALTSSAMEGTYTTNDELALLEAGEEKTARFETLEVNNYKTALFHAVELMDSLPISRRLICETHEKLLGGLPMGRGGNKRPGEYKVYQNWIGGNRIEDARFVPPPPEEAIVSMNDLERFINRDADALDPLIEAAMVHYQFETIHPFADGNGRVGRILISLILLSRNAIKSPIFYPSAAIEPRKDEYIDLMYNVSSKGNWTDWIRFFLEICYETCDTSNNIIDSLIFLNNKYKIEAMKKYRSNNVIRIIDEIFNSPVISTPIVERILGVTHRAARMTIGSLEELGILEKMQIGSKTDYFIAREILALSR